MNPAKKSRPISTPTNLDVIIRCISSPGFAAYSRILGLRISNGETTAAYAQLVHIGVRGATANSIIEDWPDMEIHKTSIARRLGLTLAEFRMLHLARPLGIASVAAMDWALALRASCR